MQQVWKRGQKLELARRTGLHLSYVVALTRGDRSATTKNAVKLERAAEELGLGISRMDWLYPNESKHPLMGRQGKPRRGPGGQP